MIGHEDMRTQIASRLEKLHTLDRLAEEMHGSLRGNGWDASKIAENVVKIVPQPLDRLLGKAMRQRLSQRITNSLKPVPSTPGLAGAPTVVYFPLWHVRGYHECFYLREANYKIRIDRDVVAVEVDGQTRDLMMDEQETKIAPESFKRTLKRFSRLFMGERRYFNLNDVVELAVRHEEAEICVTSDGREASALEEMLPNKWRRERIFDVTQLNVEGAAARIASSQETKESVVQRFREKLVRMPRTSKQTLDNTFQIEELTQYYLPYIHFPVARGGRIDHIIINGASADIPDERIVKSVRHELEL